MMRWNIKVHSCLKVGSTDMNITAKFSNGKLKKVYTEAEFHILDKKIT
jgi:hypothetical protein